MYFCLARTQGSVCRFFAILCLLLAFLQTGCLGQGDILVPLECASCPERCFQPTSGKSRCVACLQDSHCQESSPGSTKKCSLKNQCVCGTDDDCSSGKPFCKGDEGCVQCLTSQDCLQADPENPVCKNNRCVACQTNEQRACSPEGLENLCSFGFQTCQANFTWSTCKDWSKCKSGEVCHQGVCHKDCPSETCEEGKRTCVTEKDVVPGRYRVCKKLKEGCTAFSEEKTCGKDEACFDGECIPVSCPPAECKLAETQCTGSNAYKECIKNKSKCVVWSKTSTTCKGGVACDKNSGRCGLCNPGEKKDCYSGKKGTKGVGGCKSGSQSCSKDGFSWGKCLDEVLPSKESCNGLDDDCDGEVDNGFADLGKPCVVGKGACGAKGSFVCRKDGSGVQCDASPKKASPEKCNGLDDDCDGKIDHTKGESSSLTEPCYSGKKSTLGIGACKQGKKICTKGKWSSCQGEVLPSTSELCDGLDNDCDGKVDEDFARLKLACTVGKGECQSQGVYVCANDQKSERCDAKPKKSRAELCDGLDNDCDGKVDEDFVQKGQSCTVGKGECQSQGVYVCNPGKTSVLCNGNKKAPQAEVCDGKDNDCDGKVDEDFDSDGDGFFDASNILCKQSYPAVKLDCNDNNKDISPVGKEACDGIDNDCDGKVDEDFDSDSDGAFDQSLASCKKVHPPEKLDCDDKDPSVAPSLKEVCDKKDNDCDGKVDEDFDSDSDGAYASAGTTCSAHYDKAQLDCDDKSKKKAPHLKESCDGLDNNCDGVIDEKSTCPPDLAFESVSYKVKYNEVKDKVGGRSVLSFTIKVKNLGGDTGKYITNRVYYRSAKFQEEIHIKGFPFTGMDRGATKTIQLEIRLPINVVHGKGVLSFRLDYTKNVLESDETNNVFDQEITIQHTPEISSMLQNVEKQSSFATDKKVKIFFSLQNAGLASNGVSDASNEPIEIAFYLLNASNITSSDKPFYVYKFKEHLTTGVLKNGGVGHLELELPLPHTNTGYDILGMVADYQEKLPCPSCGNRTDFLKIELPRSDLEIVSAKMTSPVDNTLLGFGMDISFEVQVKNNSVNDFNQFMGVMLLAKQSGVPAPSIGNRVCRLWNQIAVKAGHTVTIAQTCPAKNLSLFQYLIPGEVTFSYEVNFLKVAPETDYNNNILEQKVTVANLPDFRVTSAEKDSTQVPSSGEKVKVHFEVENQGIVYSANATDFTLVFEADGIVATTVVSKSDGIAKLFPPSVRTKTKKFSVELTIPGVKTTNPATLKQAKVTVFLNKSGKEKESDSTNNSFSFTFDYHQYK